MEHIAKEKLKIAQSFMKKQKIGFWLVYCRGESDPTFYKLAGQNTVEGAIIVTPKTHKVIVHELDKENFDKKFLKTFKGEIITKIVSCLNELKFDPKNHGLAMNYSSQKLLDTENTDLLGYSTKKFLEKGLNKGFGTNIKTVSAEQIIYTIHDSKTKTELEKMKKAAVLANKILEKTFQEIRPGMSEIKIANIVKKIMGTEKNRFLKKTGVLDLKFSWSDPCPIVLAGENLAKPGHTSPSKKIVRQGETIYIDFGVKIFFADGTSYSSDIQRMGYVLKKNQTKPPKEVQLVFDTLIEAINKGREFLKPGVKGFEVDSVVRNHVMSVFGKKGNYQHGTGHPIGEKAHNPGTPLSVKYVPGTKKLSHRTSLKVQPWGVYTIEPRVQIPNGGSVEVMCVVNPEGKNYFLDGGQKQLYLVKP